MSGPNSPRASSPVVLVVGAGIAGAFAAYFAASRGLRTVLIDRDGVGTHASGHNPGGLNPLHGPGIPGDMQALALQAFHLHLNNWESIGRLSAMDFSSRRVSRIFVALEPDDLDLLQRSRSLYESATGFSTFRKAENWLKPGHEYFAFST